jgi:hypothetical protein
MYLGILVSWYLGNMIERYNNSVEFKTLFIIYVPSQQLQGQLQTEQNADIGNYITDRCNIEQG